MQSRSYNKFWQRLHHLAGEAGFPLRVMFELTYRCNFEVIVQQSPGFSPRKNGRRAEPVSTGEARKFMA
jgi:hypothetical protein